MKKIIIDYIYSQHWTIGFIENSIQDIIKNGEYTAHYVGNMPSDKWFADPFILDYNEKKVVVLVEEFDYKIKKGRIAKLTIDRETYNLVDCVIILDISTHLSFPFILRKNNNIYICPENSASGEWCMYEFNINNDELLNKKCIIKKPLTDGIITDLFGETLIFSTCLPSQNGNVLHAYSIDGTLKQEIIFPSNIARNAGDWFSYCGKVYRPAQDCNGCYGNSIILQEVKRKENGCFYFTDVRRIKSSHPQFTTGCHTINTYKELTVIDVHGYRRPGLAHMAEWLRIKLKGEEV